MDAPLLALTRRRARPPHPGKPFSAGTENMRQLVQLRWLAVGGQLATILVVAFGLGVPLPLAAMLGVLAATALLNLASAHLLRRYRVTQPDLLCALMFDVGSLTLQLYLSGGATNPFVSLYLLQVVLGAILLDGSATWILVAVTSLCFALLAERHRPLVFPPDLLPDVGGLRTLGGWSCFVLVGSLLVMFVTRIVRNVRVRDARLADLRQQAAEEDHLVRLGLFASGAAHELGTPLATLSVILGDWRRMPRLAADPELMGEIAEMQAEVQRCKAIVTDVLHSVGEHPGGTPEQMPACDLLADVVDRWRALHPATPLAFDEDVPGDLAVAADPALRQAISNVLDNAAEASPAAVAFTARVQDNSLQMTVADHGPGFPPAMLADIGTPHRSTKGPGHGVGLFLVASVVRKLGGTLRAANRAGGGAEVTLGLPLATLDTGGVAPA